MSISRCSGTLGKVGLFLKPVSSAVAAARLGPVPPPGGPSGVKRRRAGAELRLRSPHLALRRPRPRLWVSEGIGGAPGGENVTSAGSGGRRGEAARTCPCPSRRPRPLGHAHRRRPPPSERLERRQHDFCLQAGFPPGHDGRGTSASSGPNVSRVPGGTGGRAGVLPATPAGQPLPSRLPEAPKRERQARRLLCPGTRVETPDLLPALGLGTGGECPDPPGGAGTGVRNGVRGTGQPGRRGAARGARRPRVWAGGWPPGRGVPGWRARVHARATGIAGLLAL